MKYQLVLQFRGDSLEDLDATVALEDQLIGELGDTADVDGHDVGSGETNIFIFTPDPQMTFRQLRPVLERTNSLQTVTVAYRLRNGNDYIVIWPEASTKVFRIV